MLHPDCTKHLREAEAEAAGGVCLQNRFTRAACSPDPMACDAVLRPVGGAPSM